MADIYKDVMYDYCAILIISILIITTILRRMVKGKVNRSFMEVLVVAWLAVLFDVWARYLDNLGYSRWLPSMQCIWDIWCCLVLQCRFILHM